MMQILTETNLTLKYYGMLPDVALPVLVAVRMMPRTKPRGALIATQTSTDPSLSFTVNVSDTNDSVGAIKKCYQSLCGYSDFITVRVLTSAQLNEQLHNTSHFGWGISKLEKTTQMEKLSGHEKAWAKTLSYTKT